MKRRDFIACLGSATVFAGFRPQAARAQQALRPVVGFLSGRSADESATVVNAFRRGLAEAGYVEGKDIAVVYRWANGQYDRLPALASELLDQHVAVIAATGMILAALYVLLMYQRTMHGPLNPALPKMRDLSTREAWVIAPVLALVIALGVYPKPLLDVITPAVNATMHDIGTTDPGPTAVKGGSK